MAHRFDHSEVSTKQVRVALLGLGTVGRAVLEILREQESSFIGRDGVSFEVTCILVRDAGRERPEAGTIPVTTHYDDVLATKPHIIVEAIGNVEPAYSYVHRALSLGINVITANKMLISAYHEELSTQAAESGAQLLFEASVAGGIPIIRLLQTYLIAEPIQRVSGIFNGTTNFMLSNMASGEHTYAAALQQAQQLGYAEADPGSDVDGYDALFKLQILATLAFGLKLPGSLVQREGIRRITPADMLVASELGFTLKLLASISRTDNGIEAWVGPTLIPAAHPLAAVDGCNNAVCIQGHYVGKLTLTGPGAGGFATGSAIVADLVTAARRSGVTVGGEVKAPPFHFPLTVSPGRCRSLVRVTHEKDLDDSFISHALRELGASVEQIAATVMQEETIHRSYIISESSPVALRSILEQLMETPGIAEAVSYRVEEFEPQ